MEWRSAGPRLTVDDIRAFEQEIECDLPEDYKQFLLKNNGGVPELEHCHPSHPLCPVVFWRLLPPGQRGMRVAYDDLLELEVEGYLPFGGNLNDEDFCMDIRKNIGAIYLAKYTLVHSRRVAANLTLIANSFTEFFKGLSPIPEIYCPLQELGELGTVADFDEYLSEGNSIDALSKNDMSILCEAIKFRNTPLIHAFIERGGSLTGALRIAVINRCPEVVKLLVAAGADINERDEFGDTPFSYIGGTKLPGEEGAINRELETLLLDLGAVE